MNKDNGGQAFPCSTHYWQKELDNGMTRRDWLAGLAMQAYRQTCVTEDRGLIAKWAYKDADAVIKEGKK